jgi:hypothetical protein
LIAAGALPYLCFLKVRLFAGATLKAALFSWSFGEQFSGLSLCYGLGVGIFGYTGVLLTVGNIRAIRAV